MYGKEYIMEQLINCIDKKKECDERRENLLKRSKRIRIEKIENENENETDNNKT